MQRHSGEAQSSNIGHCMERQCSGGSRAEYLASIAVGTTVGASASIDFRRFTRGEFTAGEGLTSLAWHTSDDGVTFAARYTHNDEGQEAALTTAVTAGRRYAMPAELAGAHYVKAVGNAAGALLRVSLKS